MERKKFTVSVTPELKEKLDEIKKEQYSGLSQNTMLEKLIIEGLSTFEHENHDEN